MNPRDTEIFAKHLSLLSQEYQNVAKLNKEIYELNDKIKSICSRKLELEKNLQKYKEYGLKNFKHLNKSAYVVDSFATILSPEEAIVAINQSNVSKTSTAHIGNQICSVLSAPVPNNTNKKFTKTVSSSQTPPINPNDDEDDLIVLQHGTNIYARKNSQNGQAQDDADSSSNKKFKPSDNQD